MTTTSDEEEETMLDSEEEEEEEEEEEDSDEEYELSQRDKKSRSRAERESVAGWDGQNCLRERLEQSETAGTERGHLEETFSTAGTRRGAANG